MEDLLNALHQKTVGSKEFKERFYDEYNRYKRRLIHADVIMYSFKLNEHDHINRHEFNRLRHSIASIRKFNWENTVEVFLFCDDLSAIPAYFEDEYDVQIVQSYEYDPTMLNAWSVHRWFNLQHFKDRSCNILYVDSDTVFYSDPKYLFRTYSSFDVYGKEERGFRHCPIAGSGKDIRFQLDVVDACIKVMGGNVPIYKFCIGVILLNNNIHKKIVSKLDQFIDIMDGLKANEVLNPIPNPRILDQYAMWIIWSRISATNALFGVQDVTHGWIEVKHAEYFNPVLLHYTTRDEQKFAKSNPEYNNLIRDVEELGISIDPHSMV